MPHITLHPLTRRTLAFIVVTCLLLPAGGSWPASAAAPSATVCDAPWQTIATRTIDYGGSLLRDIAAAGTDDYWAVGNTQPLVPQMLIQHWDGARWTTADTPSFVDYATNPYGAAVLTSLGVVAPNNIWAVGTVGTGFFVEPAEALVMRWDGASWTRMPNSGALATLIRLDDVTVVSATNIWAIGMIRSGNAAEAAFAHWDGAAWSVTPAPAISGQPITLSSISAASATDIWAVGQTGDPGMPTPAILHSTGAGWTSVASPVAKGLLTAVDTGPAGQVWVTGQRGLAPLALRWDGAAFQQTITPESLSTAAVEMRAITVSAANDVWAVGGSGTGGVAMHWDGTAWDSFAQSSDATRSTNYYGALTPTPGDLWVVGGGESTLVQRYATRLGLGSPRIVAAGAGRAVDIPLYLTSPAATNVRVAVRTEDAGAVAGRDYVAQATTISIPACATAATVRVPLIAGATLPAGAAFRLVVGTPSGAGGGGTARRALVGGTTQRVAAPAITNGFPTGPTGQIAYVGVLGPTEWDIFRMRADGSGQTRLTAAPGLDYNPSWSPDGARIGFVSERDGNPEIYVMNADGSGQVRLTDSPGLDSMPAWSPDGTRIAFASERTGARRIYVMSPSGGAVRQISPEGGTRDSNPSWSPDGTQIAFSSQTLRQAGIYLIAADGSGLRQLTNQYEDDNPAWSPDGAQIAFGRQNVNLPGLYAMRGDGSGLHEVNANFDTGRSPAWSPDGRFLVSGTTADGTLQILGIDHTAPFMPPGVQRRAFNPAWSTRP